MKDTKLTIAPALALAFAFSSMSAPAAMVRHRPGVRTHDVHRSVAPVRSVHRDYGDPNGSTGASAGGYLWNGRSASEWGGG